jgi:hypothetical protein
MVERYALVLVSFAALALGADRAVAQTRPWCLIQPGLATTCIYYTFDQCLAARVGSSNHCGRNPDHEDGRTGKPATRERRR